MWWIKTFTAEYFPGFIAVYQLPNVNFDLILWQIKTTKWKFNEQNEHFFFSKNAFPSFSAIFSSNVDILSGHLEIFNELSIRFNQSTCKGPGARNGWQTLQINSSVCLKVYHLADGKNSFTWWTKQQKAERIGYTFAFTSNERMKWINIVVMIFVDGLFHRFMVLAILLSVRCGLCLMILLYIRIAVIAVVITHTLQLQLA